MVLYLLFVNISSKELIQPKIYFVCIRFCEHIFGRERFNACQQYLQYLHVSISLFFYDVELRNGFMQQMAESRAEDVYEDIALFCSGPGQFCHQQRGGRTKLSLPATSCGRSRHGIFVRLQGAAWWQHCNYAVDIINTIF